MRIVLHFSEDQLKIGFFLVNETLESLIWLKQMRRLSNTGTLTPEEETWPLTFPPKFQKYSKTGLSQVITCILRIQCILNVSVMKDDLVVRNMRYSCRWQEFNPNTHLEQLTTVYSSSSKGSSISDLHRHVRSSTQNPTQTHIHIHIIKNKQKRNHW